MIVLLFYKTFIVICAKLQVQVLIVLLFFVSKVDLFAFSDKTRQYNVSFFLTREIDLAAANHINQASIIKLTKQSAGFTQNSSTTLVAESKNGHVSEIAGEPV